MPLITIIIIVAIIIYSLTKQQSKQGGNRTNQRMWPEAAHYHGLQLYAPDDKSVFPSMSGMVDGLPVEVWGDFDESGQGLVFCRVDFALHLPFRLSIIKGNFNSDSVGSSFEIRGLTAPGISVSASDSKELHAFLTEQNMNILKNCLGGYHSVKITDSCLILGASGINDGMKLYGFIERAAASAKALSGGHTVTVPAAKLPKIQPVEDSDDVEFSAQERRPATNVMPTVSAIPEEAEPQEIFNPAPPAEAVIPPTKPEFKSVTSVSKPVAETPSEAVTPPQKTEFKPITSISKPVAETPAEVMEENLDLSAEALCQALFSASFPGEKEKALFQKAIGKTVHWRGTLKSVYPYSTDFVFGKGPGAKATFEICEVASGYGMKNRIKATVSFSEETLSVLKGQTGKEFAFTGNLLKMEGFSREILLEKGTLAE